MTAEPEDYQRLHYLGLPQLTLKEIGILWGAAFVIIGIYILVSAVTQ
jgi:hypothetical protein